MIEALLMIAVAFFPTHISNDDAVLYMIMMTESQGQEIKLHADKTSYGLFGLTKVACDEVGEEWPPETPKDEYRAAKKYLHHMAEAHSDDLFEAAGWYHGGSLDRRTEYVKKLAKANVTDETVSLFKGFIEKDK